MTLRTRLSANSIVEVRGQPAQIVAFDPLQEGYAICRELTTGTTFLASVSDLQPSRAALPRQLELLDYSELDLNVAQYRFEIIEPLVHGATIKEMEMRAAEFDISKATVYRWLKRYDQGSGLSALVPIRNKGTGGRSFLDSRVETVISETLSDYYLTIQKPKVSPTCLEIRRRCFRLNISSPSRAAVQARIDRLDPLLVARLRGEKKRLRDTMLPRPGIFNEADGVLSLVEIDHTELDVLAVDEESRDVIGRPHLTVAVDVFSRMITGLHLSMTNDGTAGVARCLAMTICSKDAFLRDLGIEASWPIRGFPVKVHTDNGRDLTSLAIARACAEHQIILARRPVGLSYYGGHMERLLGTAVRNMHDIPGTTYSSIVQRADYDSKKHAAVSLRALLEHLVRWITCIYHESVHQGIGMKPLQKYWDSVLGKNGCIPVGLPDVSRDERQLQIDFMPAQERTVGRQGIQWDGVLYYDRCLDRFIGRRRKGARSPKILVRRDPSDMTRLFFKDPANDEYVEIRTSRLSRPRTSLKTFHDTRSQLKAAGACADESAIFDAIEKNRRLIESEVQKTKAVRALKKREEKNRTRPNRTFPVTAQSDQNDVADTGEGVPDLIRLPARLADLR